MISVIAFDLLIMVTTFFFITPPTLLLIAMVLKWTNIKLQYITVVCVCMPLVAMSNF